MAKAAKEAIYLVSSEGTGYYYTFRRNKRKARTGGEKLKLKKYDPIARKHTLFEEKKLSKLKKKYRPEEQSTSAE